MGRLLFSGCDGDDTRMDLCLQSGADGAAGCPSSTVLSYASRSRPPPSSPTLHHHRAPLTIFYGGQIFACQVTEDQARAIIAAARRGKMDHRRVATAAWEEDEEEEEEEKEEEETPSKEERKDKQHGRLHPLTPLAQLSPQQQINLGASMRRSLQRFLQNRRARAGPRARRFTIQSRTPTTMHAHLHDRQRRPHI